MPSRPTNTEYYIYEDERELSVWELNTDTKQERLIYSRTQPEEYGNSLSSDDKDWSSWGMTSKDLALDKDEQCWRAATKKEVFLYLL